MGYVQVDIDIDEYLDDASTNKNYYKCELMGASNSEASDIKLKMVCDNFLIS